MQEERILKILVDLQYKVNKLYETAIRRDEFDVFKDKIFTILDAQGVMLLRHDQEITLILENIRRQTERIDRLYEKFFPKTDELEI
jgi:hypothetical protein